MLGALILMFVTACRTESFAQKPIAASPPPQRLQTGDTTASIIVQGQQRTYTLHVPKSYRSAQAMPLVVVFHGYGGQGKNLAQSTGFNALADQQGFIVAYPDGIDRRWRIATGEDVTFTAELISQLQHRGAIDPHRTYVAGISNGGFLVQQLACQLPDRITAFASVVATLPSDLQSSCRPSAPISMLMMNGTDDPKVPWTGGVRPYGSILSVPETVRFWQRHNQCSTPAKVQVLNSRVQIDRASCPSGAEVELVALKGVGHLFPRGGGGANSLIDGSREIWQFFQRHRQ